MGRKREEPLPVTIFTPHYFENVVDFFNAVI